MRNRTTDQIKSEIKIKITLIRHGETKSNEEHRYLGTTDEALSEQGRVQLEHLRENGDYPIPGKLFVSPMLRCVETAEILFPDCEFVCIPEWTEMKFGLFEGKNYEELNGNEEYQAWIDSEGMLPFPEGESRAAFQERVMRGFEKMLDFLRESQTDLSTAEIVAIVHGGTIMALCSRLLGGDYFDYQLKCGEKYECFITIQ